MRFKGFILFAEMRTGSNHLEESLNQAEGLTCHGEAFNPSFVGRLGQDALCGIPIARRDAAPQALLDAMVAQTPGLPGFRYFHDHDPRALDLVLQDPSWAKVILTRDPLESFVSREIARTTNQWRITDAEDRRQAKVTFDPEAFALYKGTLDGFQAGLRRALKRSGQVAFDIDYSEILDVAVLNGMLAFLGVDGRLTAPSARLKRQNPEPLREKVTNPEDLDQVDTERGAIAAPDLAPVLSGLRADGKRLLVALPGVPQAALPGYDQASPLAPEALRPWLNRTKGHRVVTAVSHPVARAFRLARDNGLAPDLHGLLEAVKYATCADPAVRPQADLLAGLAPELLADEIRRAPDDDLPDLGQVYGPETESVARDVYNRDYRLFGYGKWRSGHR